MAAKRVPNEVIKAAAKRWRGNVAGASAEVRMKRDHFRERCNRLSIDLDALRRGRPPCPLPPPMPPPAPGSLANEGDPVVSRAPYPRLIEMPILQVVSSAVTEFERRADKPIRVEPRHGDRIRSGRRRLSVEADTDLDDTQLLAEFIEEGFDGWLKAKLETIRQARDARTAEDIQGSEKP